MGGAEIGPNARALAAPCRGRRSSPGPTSASPQPSATQKAPTAARRRSRCAQSASPRGASPPRPRLPEPCERAAPRTRRPKTSHGPPAGRRRSRRRPQMERSLRNMGAARGRGAHLWRHRTAVADWGTSAGHAVTLFGLPMRAPCRPKRLVASADGAQSDFAQPPVRTSVNEGLGPRSTADRPQAGPRDRAPDRLHMTPGSAPDRQTRLSRSRRFTPACGCARHRRAERVCVTLPPLRESVLRLWRPAMEPSGASALESRGMSGSPLAL